MRKITKALEPFARQGQQIEIVYELGLTCFIDIRCSNGCVEVSQLIKAITAIGVEVTNICLYAGNEGESNLAIYISPKTIDHELNEEISIDGSKAPATLIQREAPQE